LGESKINKLTLLIPCYNEASGIGEVISNIPSEQLKSMGYNTEVIVIDNNSTDETAQIARSSNATVINEPKQGKGHAILTGFKNIPSDSNLVAMIDGDASYDIKELPRLIEPIHNSFAEVIVGTRLNGRLYNGSMKGFNRFGNWFLTFLARVGYKSNITDVCSGFFVWKKCVVDDLSNHLKSNGFSIEMEMIAKMARLNYGCYSVPISYVQRNGFSSLRPIKDGFTIFHTWLKYLNWRPKRL